MLTPQQQDAVLRIAQAAVLSEKQTGLPAELTTSQCIFESAYLTRCPGNNAFGIKQNHHGNGVQYTVTHEFLNGTWVEQTLAFETYPTLWACFADHARLLQSGVYADAWKQYATDLNLEAYIMRVAAHYATDPTYASKMIAECHSQTVQLACQAARQS